MPIVDLNLLRILDILIEERSVTRAADRLGISTPSASRMLARLRAVTGDALLARAGREMVPTARALAMQIEAHRIVEAGSELLRPEAMLDPATLDRRFTIRANDGFITAFAALLAGRIAAEAPKVILRFAPEGESDDDALREGRIDLDIGALREMGPEVRIQTIFRDHYAGLARPGHPIFDGELSAERFAAFDQISVSRRGRATGPIDEALDALGLVRRVPLIVPYFQSAITALPHTDLIGLVPRHVLNGIAPLKHDLRAFDLPLPLETIVVAQAWHPRFDGDAGHRFLRQCVREICARAFSQET